MFNRRALFVSLTALALAAPWPAVAQQTALPVVASFSIIGDLLKQVGGSRVAVTTLVGPNADAHVYSPTPADGKALSEARLVVVNGLKFEAGWMEKLFKASGTKAKMIVASQGITPLNIAGPEGHAHAHNDKHGHDRRGEADPHAWQDVKNVRKYVENIRDALVAADEAGRDEYIRNADAYLAKLDQLDTDIRETIGKIPAAQRKAIISHDALAYFSNAYGLTLVAPKGVSTEAEVSAKDLARIVRQVKAEKIAAVFMENIQDRRLADQIVRETGARIGGTLYSDALSPPGGPGADYIAMMRHNVKQFALALAPTS